MREPRTAIFGVGGLAVVVANGRWIAFFSEGRRLPNRIWRLSVATQRLV